MARAGVISTREMSIHQANMPNQRHSKPTLYDYIEEDREKADFGTVGFRLNEPLSYRRNTSGMVFELLPDTSLKKYTPLD